MTDPKPLARKGDVKPVVSDRTNSEDHPGASGKWVLGPAGITETLAEHASSGQPLVVEAKATFLYAGTESGSGVEDKEDVVLTGVEHALHVAEGWPLRDEEQKAGKNGNGLKVESEAVWRSA